MVQVGPAGDRRVLPLCDPVVEREHLVPLGLGVEDALQLGEQLGRSAARSRAWVQSAVVS